MRNRLKMPTKHILVLEDVLINQARIAKHFADIFEHEGLVEVSYIAGGDYAVGIINENPIDLIILDHDMPHGEGDDFLKWLNFRDFKIPVITFSGIPSNNDHLMSLGAYINYTKEAVINGGADETIIYLLFTYDANKESEATRSSSK